MAKVRAKGKSWTYSNTVSWRGERKGVLSAAAKPDIEVATPPDFGGHHGVWSPEDFFVAAVNCCIMTTFLYYRAKADIDLVSYRSTAEGILEYGERGLMFTRVEVRPVVQVASELDLKKTREALQRSEKSCLVSNSINSAVVVEPQIELGHN